MSPPGLQDMVEALCCALCGSGEATTRFVDGAFRVLRCEGCDLTRVSPRLPEGETVERVYDASYWRSPAARERGYADYRADAELYLRTFERRRRRIAAHLPAPGRVLDVGCAAGYFLAVMERAGWGVAGVEPSAPIRAAARERLGASALLAESLDDPRLAAGGFELVTLWDVLEHLHDPVAALARARELLAPGGRVVVETQDVASPTARLLGRRWHHYKHLEHLHHFHRGTLERALGRAGLRVVRMTRRAAGKYVRPDFLVERSARLHPLLPHLLRRFAGGVRPLYVNPRDEWICVAERA